MEGAALTQSFVHRGGTLSSALRTILQSSIHSNRQAPPLVAPQHCQNALKYHPQPTGASHPFMDPPPRLLGLMAGAPSTCVSACAQRPQGIGALVQARPNRLRPAGPRVYARMGVWVVGWLVARERAYVHALVRVHGSSPASPSNLTTSCRATGSCPESCSNGVDWFGHGLRQEPAPAPPASSPERGKMASAGAAAMTRAGSDTGSGRFAGQC